MILFGPRTRRVSFTPMQWKPWVTVPSAANKTSGSRQITTLNHIGDRLFVGYGDWGANNGPTDVVSVGIDSGDVQVHLKDVPTEAIDHYRVLDGAIYGPCTDPKWYWGSGGYVTNAGGTWRVNESPPDMVHTFDIAKNADGLWLCGSRLDSTNSDVGHSVVILSKDDGQTWETVYQGEEATAYSRIYWITALSDGVYTLDHQGVVRHTVDGGTTWDVVSGASVFAARPTNVITVGGYEYRGTSEGTIERRKHIVASSDSSQSQGVGGS